MKETASEFTKLDPQERKALRLWRELHGRSWRNWLETAWESGNGIGEVLYKEFKSYHPHLVSHLQHLRNSGLSSSDISERDFEVDPGDPDSIRGWAEENVVYVVDGTLNFFTPTNYYNHSDRQGIRHLATLVGYIGEDRTTRFVAVQSYLSKPGDFSPGTPLREAVDLADDFVEEIARAHPWWRKAKAWQVIHPVLEAEQSIMQERGE